MRNITLLLFNLTIITTIFLSGCERKEEEDSYKKISFEKDKLRLNTSDKEGVSDWETFGLPKEPNLSDYLHFSEQNSPGLRAMFYSWKAALERVPQARSLPDPKFGYAYDDMDDKSTFSLSQMLPWPSKLIDGADRSLQETRVEEHRYEAKRLELFYNVRKAYYEYYYLNRSNEILKENLALLENLEGVVLGRYKVGTAKSPSLLQIQVELGVLEDRLKSAEALRPTLAAELNAAMGRDPSLPLPWPQGPLDEPTALEMGALQEALRQDNPQLKAAQERIRASEAGFRLARAQYFPDFGIGASLVKKDRASGMAMGDRDTDSFMLMFELSIPVWHNKYAAATREAEAMNAAAAGMLEEEGQRLSSDLRVALYYYEDAGRKLSLFRDALLSKAAQAIEVAQTAYMADEATYGDLIDAERNLLEIRLSAERALVDRNIRLAEMERLCGRELREARPLAVPPEKSQGEPLP
ncbi:MAG: TolC family protein [Planctomycetota bacterium]